MGTSPWGGSERGPSVRAMESVAGHYEAIVKNVPAHKRHALPPGVLILAARPDKKAYAVTLGLDIGPGTVAAVILLTPDHRVRIVRNGGQWNTPIVLRIAIRFVPHSKCNR